MEEKRSSATFAVTFNLLSQYIKDNSKKPFPTASASPAAARQTPTTMPLLAGAAVLDDEEALRKACEIQLFPQRAGFDGSKDSSQEKSKLTIFYGGKVLVFDSFPAEKAREIMQFASDARNNGVGPQQQASPPTKQPPRPPAEMTGIPLARNNSLRRFLQIRKDRIKSRAPYQVTIKKEKEEDEKESSSSSTWLGLGPQMSSFSSFNSESSR